MADSPGQIYPILGTLTVGPQGQVKPPELGMMLRTFVGASCAKAPGGAMLDVCRIFRQAPPDGDAEAVLGEIFDSSPSMIKRTRVATNASPAQGALTQESIVEQCNASLEKLGVDFVDLFYLHASDAEANVDELLAGVDQLHKEGKFKELGLADFPAWAVEDIWQRCKDRGTVLPTVYQGPYNVIARSLESELVPIVRKLGLRLHVHSPLAGGLLTGRYSSVEDLENATQGRFSEEFDRGFQDKVGTETYRGRYSKLPVFDGLGVLRQALVVPDAAAGDSAAAAATVQESVTVVNGVRVQVQITESTAAPQARAPEMASIALRWLLHHSCLASGDGIVLGVSRTPQLVANLAAWQAGPLPAELVEASDKAWEAARPACEPYFRGRAEKPGVEEQPSKLEAEAPRA